MSVDTPARPSRPPTPPVPPVPPVPPSRWGRLPRPTRRTRILASVLAVGVTLAGLAWATDRSEGYPTEHVEPNDGAVWVTNDRTGLVGRLNKPAGGLDAALAAADRASQTHQLDMLQSGTTVVARDRVGARLVPVDVRLGRLVRDKGIPVQSSSRVAVGGPTVAVLDPATGAIRASRAGTDQVATVDGVRDDAKALALVKVTDGVDPTRASAMAVTPDGTVHAVGSSGQTVELVPSTSGRYTVRRGSVGASLQDVQVTTVGGRRVVVDTVGLVAVLPDGTKVFLPTGAKDGVVQQVGGAGDKVLLASRAGLWAIDLGSGAATALHGAATGTPAAPVVTPSCRYAVWAGTPGLAVRQCGGRAAEPVTLAGSPNLLSPQVRVNRGTAVLNDGATGAVWDLDTGARLDNWAAVAPPTTARPRRTTQGETLTQSQRRPRAVKDDLGARPGRTSVLHVLDNDTNPSGSVLSIRSVSSPSPATASVSVAPDGQAVQLAMQPGSGSVSFTYTIDDGKGQQSSAEVRVHARSSSDNGTPVLRKGFAPTSYAVAAQGRLSLPVIGDWRDPDSDPVVLSGARDDTRVVAVSNDGRIQYVAPDRSGARRLAYTVSDGRETSQGQVAVQVLATDSTAATAPTTQPDVGRGEVGQPIVIRPLDNDLPGADPSSPEARLEIAGDVVAPGGLTATTNLRLGTVTITAGAPGTRLLTYTARYGDAPYARGTIRVDVSPRQDRSATPVAMLDQAVVHGETAAIVDVLANDYNPSGRLLVVQRAEADASGSFEVAIIRGRWLRVKPLRPDVSPNPGRLRYSVTDGVGPTVTGEVSVQQLPVPRDSTPTPVDDYATVRSGDSTALAVTDNDTDPGGDPLSLVAQPDTSLASGVLPVTGPGPASADRGTAYVAGNVVRYQAPTVTAATTMRVSYVVEDPGQNRATGTAYLTVLPPPTADRPDQAPTPPEIEARVVSGDTLILQVATTGADPDGDSVTLSGIDSAPRQGRIMETSPSSITYQAFPTARDTDALTYLVTDRYGKTGTGTVRIAVLPPGDPQPPLAVDDLVTAAPGATLRVDPVANDIVAIGDTVRMQPLQNLNPLLPAGTTADLTKGTVTLKAPDAVSTKDIRYAVRGASGVDTSATIRVRAQEGYNVPPIARNAFAAPAEDATDVTVDVLRSASDPDGDAGAIKVTRVFNAPGASIRGPVVVVPVLERPQVLAYEIEDAGGAKALATVFVPSVGDGLPHVRRDSLVHVDRDASTTVPLDEIVASPAGRPVILTTTDRLAAAPGQVRIEAVGRDKIRVSGRSGYIGPAAATFEVTDGSSATDPAGHRALLTVPVQVGPETPVLRCPPTELAVVQGGRSRPVSIPELCHVWTARPGQAADLHYVGGFPHREPGLSVSNQNPSTLVVSATGDARAGTPATMEVTVPGTQTVPAVMKVTVTPAGAPTVAPILLSGVRAGTSRSVDIAGYVSSPLANPSLSIARIEKVSGATATVTPAGGTTLAVIPDDTAKGRIVYRVVVSDVGSASTTRLGVGSLTVEVLGRPDAPGTPTQSGPTQSSAVRLQWAAPANNGLPIGYYTVSWRGGSQRCPASPCQITGLDNGRGYAFTVTAHNAVGDGPPSKPSAKLMPDTVPGAPVDPKTSDPGDGRLTVSWDRAPVDGSPVTKYLVTWPGGRRETDSLSAVATGLDNNVRTTFTIKAFNRAGWGESVTTEGQSAGKPSAPAAPSLDVTESADGSEQVVVVTWKSVSPNGPGDTTYKVLRTHGDSTTTICDHQTDTECRTSVTNDGGSYSYAVQAANDVSPGPVGASKSLLAVGRPGEFTNVDATATGTSQKVQLRFTSPEAHDSGVTITCSVGGSDCGSWTAGRDPEKFSETITVPSNGGTPTITLTARNRSDRTSTATVTSDTVFGPPTGAGISAINAQGPYVAFTATVDAQGRGVDVTISVVADGTTVRTYTDTTGTGVWSNSYVTKVGFRTPVTVTVKASRDKQTDSGSASTTTGSGKVSASGSPASTCVAGQPCQDVAMRVAVDGFGVNLGVTCAISAAGRNLGSVGIGTDGNGSGSAAVPETTLVATSGTTYTIRCDDANQPDAIASDTWTAP